MGQFEAKLNSFREGICMNPQWTDLPTITILDIYQEVLKEWRGGHQVNGQIAFARAIEANIKGVKHMIRKPVGLTAPHRRVDDDDDIQDYRRPWVGLTDMERQMVINKHEGVAWETAIAIEAKLKEKNA